MLCLTSCSKYPEVKECVQKYLEEMANHDSISINDNLLIKPGDSPKTMNDYKCYNYSDYKITNIISKHSNKCTFYSLRFGCSFAVANTIKPQLL